MFHNLKSTTERLVTVLMLVGALIACEQVPESTSESDNNNLVPIESQKKFLNNTQSLIGSAEGSTSRSAFAGVLRSQKPR